MGLRFVPALITTLLFSLLTIAGGSANAQVVGESTCSFSFEVKGTDIQVLIGRSKLNGYGTIRCEDPHGNTEVLNVKVTVGTPVLFPRIAFAPSVVVRGESTGITVPNGGPQGLLGQYLTVDIRGSLTSGAGATLSILNDDSGLALNLVLVGVEGFGIAVGGTIVTLE
ncbi:MAG: hypothetical protein J0L82_14225 [Deltaproteobacteria bacterium]|nr:hypothetical protein [Deltaproteobacteria bacterium]